jgi:hypothetical protein
MLNTMDGFSVYDVEDYFVSYKSFKGKDIYDWILDHLISDSMDEKQFAKFLKRKYVKNNKFGPHVDQYYYFKRVGEMECYLVRDRILSPIIDDFEPKRVDLRDFKNLLADIRSLEKRIKKSKFCTKYDLEDIAKTNKKLDYRIELLMGGEKFSFKKFDTMKRYKKMQMYSVFKDKYLDLKCIWHQIRMSRNG